MQLADEQLIAAVELLQAGDVVGLPTETVYGLAADGTNPSAIRKIFAVKGRPVDHPLILHLGDATWLPSYAVDIPEEAARLAAAFWPGPLTLVLRRSSAVPDEVTGGLATVAVRVPSHPIALQVLRALGRPLAAPSANKFGMVSPTTREHVLRDLGAEVPLVLEGGACEVGIESTILDLSGGAPRMLRPGGITREQIEGVLGRHLAESSEPLPRAPGTLEAHYATRAELQLVDQSALWNVVQAAVWRGASVGVFSSEAPPEALAPSILFSKMSTVHQAAHDLYATLRDLDDAGCTIIFATVPPVDGLGSAIADRLKRAAQGSKLKSE
jgi:L-threonylcarbamoyladenylate synthase